jgi:hypothetical protein
MDIRSLHHAGGLKSAMKWLRVSNYLRWRFSKTPVLLHVETWQLRQAGAFDVMPKGEWLLRRPITLPVSTKAVFLGARIQFK